MHAIQIDQPGTADDMVWREVPDAVAGPGEVLVRLEAAGVNLIDTYQRSGIYRMNYPFTLGLEGAGRIEALGAGVAGFDVGERVAWTQNPGSYAEMVAVPVSRAIRVPSSIPAEIAAAIPLQGMTAHYLVNSTYPVGPETTLLITAGAGGVGRLVIQLAKAKGATVITTVGSTEKTAVARAAGADHIIVLPELADLATDLPRAVRAIAQGGVDVAYDGIGKDTFDATLASVRPRGMVVLFGGASGQVAPFDLQRLNAAGSLFITRPTLAHYIADRAELDWRASDLFSAVAAGTLDIEIGLVVPLREAARAHRALEGRETHGKVILRA